MRLLRNKQIFIWTKFCECRKRMGMENIAQHIIQKCGGPAVIANWADISVQSVYRWTYPRERGGTGGLIPSEHQYPLLEKARAAGIDLSPADFFPSNAAHKSPTNAGEAA